MFRNELNHAIIELIENRYKEVFKGEKTHIIKGGHIMTERYFSFFSHIMRGIFPLFLVGMRFNFSFEIWEIIRKPVETIWMSINYYIRESSRFRIKYSRLRDKR